MIADKVRRYLASLPLSEVAILASRGGAAAREFLQCVANDEGDERRELAALLLRGVALDPRPRAQA